MEENAQDAVADATVEGPSKSAGRPIQKSTILRLVLRVVISWDSPAVVFP